MHDRRESGRSRIEVRTTRASCSRAPRAEAWRSARPIADCRSSTSAPAISRWAGFGAFVKGLGDTDLAHRINLVVNNLSAPSRACIVQIHDTRAVHALLRRVIFHYMPTHAGWLNTAQIEIAAIGRQCLNFRIADQNRLARAVASWQKRRNVQHRTIQLMFARQDAVRKLGLTTFRNRKVEVLVGECADKICE